MHALYTAADLKNCYKWHSKVKVTENTLLTFFSLEYFGRLISASIFKVFFHFSHFSSTFFAKTEIKKEKHYIYLLVILNLKS